VVAPSGPDATTVRSDYFSFLGLPRKLRIDMTDLEQRYRALSRQFHPDYFYNASASERRTSLERSSYLNDAYRTLKNPIARIEYLLTIEQSAVGSQQTADGNQPTGAHTPKVPPGLLEEVFALNEELDEVREMKADGAPPEEWRPRLERARKPIEVKRDEHEAQLDDLSTRWDASVGANADQRRAILSSLNDRLLERNYITNLLAGIERELSS
jgi:molecular chaperone HscB